MLEFCSEFKDYLACPYSVEEWTYATDGRIIIRVPRILNIGTPGATLMGNTEKLFSAWDGLKMKWMDLPDFKEEICEECKGGSCEKCDKGLKFLGTEMGNKLMSHRYLRKIMNLKGLRVSPETGGSLDAMPLMFDTEDGGAQGLLMPMRC